MSSLKPTNVFRTLVRANQKHGLKRTLQAGLQGTNVQSANVQGACSQGECLQGNSEMDKANPKGLQNSTLIHQGKRLGVTALSLT